MNSNNSLQNFKDLYFCQFKIMLNKKQESVDKNYLSFYYKKSKDININY
jgi:hypothetical protein